MSWSLRDNGRILYVSSVDVSLGNGPAVNEVEFIVALHELIGERAHFCIPEPEHAVADLPRAACTFVRPHRRHSPLPFLLSRIRYHTTQHVSSGSGRRRSGRS